MSTGTARRGMEEEEAEEVEEDAEDDGLACSVTVNSVSRLQESVTSSSLQTGLQVNMATSLVYTTSSVG